MAENDGEKFWFNTATKSVEKGPVSSWENRMGPYDTEAEARGALRRAAENSAQWDEKDAEWDR